MRKITKLEIIIMVILSVIAFVMMNRFSQLYLMSGCGQNIMDGINYAFDNYFNYRFIISLSQNVMLPSILAIISVFLIFAYYWSTKKNFMYGKEHGSARWGA